MPKTDKTEGLSDGDLLSYTLKTRTKPLVKNWKPILKTSAMLFITAGIDEASTDGKAVEEIGYATVEGDAVLLGTYG